MDSFVMYRSFYEALSELDPDTRLSVFDALCEYALDGCEPCLTGVAKAFFTLMRPALDANQKKRAAGSKGGKAAHEEDDAETEQDAGAPEANVKQTPSKRQANVKQTPSKTQANVKQTPSKTQANVKQTPSNEECRVKNEEYRVKSEDIYNSAASAHFKPPDLDEVRKYCEERGNGIDARSFVDYYAARGWMLGKVKMRDWKAAVRRWEQRREKPPSSGADGWHSCRDNAYYDIAKFDMCTALMAQEKGEKNEQSDDNRAAH